MAIALRAMASASGGPSRTARAAAHRGEAAAVDPATPAIPLPLPTRRTFLAVLLRMVWPRVTWPSPAITTLPPLRTVRIVVPGQASQEEGGRPRVLTRSGDAACCARL